MQVIQHHRKRGCQAAGALAPKSVLYAFYYGFLQGLICESFNKKIKAISADGIMGTIIFF